MVKYFVNVKIKITKNDEIKTTKKGKKIIKKLSFIVK